MNALITHRDAQGPWRPFTWKQGILSRRIPHKFDTMSDIWMVVRTVILWMLWIERNDLAFNAIRWRPDKLFQCIWLGLIDYGRMEWEGVCRARKKSLDQGDTA